MVVDLASPPRRWEPGFAVSINGAANSIHGAAAICAVGWDGIPRTVSQVHNCFKLHGPPSSMHDGSQSSKSQATASPIHMDRVCTNDVSVGAIEPYPSFRFPNQWVSSFFGVQSLNPTPGSDAGRFWPRAGKLQLTLVFFRWLHSLRRSPGVVGKYIGQHDMSA